MFYTNSDLVDRIFDGWKSSLFYEKGFIQRDPTDGWKVTHERDQVIIQKDLPGVKAPDVNVTLRDGCEVSIKAKRMFSKDLIQEYSYLYKYPYNAALKPEDIKVILQDGILTVKLWPQLVKASEPVKIPVSTL